MVEDLQEHSRHYTTMFEQVKKSVKSETKQKKRKPKKKAKQGEDDDSFLAAVIAENLIQIKKH